MKATISSNPIKKWILMFLLIVGALIVSLPFFWMILTSFKTDAEAIMVPPTLFPQRWTIDNYIKLYTELRFGTYLLNTLVIVACGYIGLFFNLLAGYAFAKFQFPGAKWLFALILATMMIPSQITMIPNYILLNRMGLTGTMMGMVLPGLVGAFSIFLFRQFISTIPNELLEAARIEGAGEFNIFFHIILPISKSIIAIQIIFTFIAGWNSFLWPLIIANDEKLYTLSVGLSLLKGQNVSYFSLQMAGASFMVLPVLIIFMLFQKRIMQNFTLSGIK